MRDFTNPVVTGMFILGALMILAATTTANAATGNNTVSAVKNRQPALVARQAHIRQLIRDEANLQMEVQRATSIHMRAEQAGGKNGHKPDPGCVVCKID